MGFTFATESGDIKHFAFHNLGVLPPELFSISTYLHVSSFRQLPYVAVSQQEVMVGCLLDPWLLFSPPEQVSLEPTPFNLEPGYSTLKDRGLPKWICWLLLTSEGGMIDNRWPVLLVYPVVRAVSLPPPRPPGLYKAVALACLLGTGLERWLMSPFSPHSAVSLHFSAFLSSFDFCCLTFLYLLRIKSDLCYPDCYLHSYIDCF